MFKSLNFICLIAILTFMACTASEEVTPILKQEKNQVWSVKEVDGSFEKDQITYLETYEYDKNGYEIGHLIYNVNGSLAGKELSVFDQDGDPPVGTRYYDAQDSLLSYYTFEYDELGQKVSRKGFDAANDELLRIERFVYDKKGNMIRKEVRDADDNLRTAYEFTYDVFGNKTKMVVTAADGSVRATEAYKITKRDDGQQWLENWGWSNDQPINFRSRELVYF